MANDGKIYITISDQRGSGTGGSIAGVPTPTHNKTSGSGGGEDSFSFATFAGTQLINTLKQNAKKVGNYAVSNIGNITGDYSAQREIQTAMEFTGKVGSIANAFATGFIASGGNIAASLLVGTLAIAGEGLNMALEYQTLMVQTSKQNRDIDMLRTRSGLDTLTNGGRTGE